jgi:hypothetical protein
MVHRVIVVTINGGVWTAVLALVVLILVSISNLIYEGD